jgi:hypothetical protein
MGTVVGMGSTEIIKPRDLVVGGRYLHRNGLFIRQIDEIEGDRVHYHEPPRGLVVVVRQECVCPGVSYRN